VENSHDLASVSRGSFPQSTPVPIIFSLALALQLVSATFLVRDVSSPNAATVIAMAVVQRGEFAVHAWPRTARTPAGDEEPLRAYHLPAEPLLIAAGIRLLPAGLTRYLHVPVTVLLVTSIAAVAFWAGGRAIGVTAGVLASLDPFILRHGPVWDDAFLAAALEWTVLAALVKAIRERSAGNRPAAWSIAAIVPIGIAAGLAALTRGSSQVVLGLAGLGLIALPRFRSLRAAGAAILAGVVLALAGWGTRNAAVAGEFHIGSSHDGITLFESNYATARPSLLRSGTVENYELDTLGSYFTAVAPMAEFDANRYFTRQAFAYIRSHPGDVLATSAVKFVTTLTGVNPAEPLTTPRNAIAAATNVALLVAGIFGWAQLARDARRPEIRLLVFLGIVVTTVTCLGMLAGPTGLRYRLSATPLLYVGAAALVTTLRRGAFGRSHTASRRAGGA
jgi:hypothetical protein